MCVKLFESSDCFLRGRHNVTDLVLLHLYSIRDWQYRAGNAH